MANKLDEDNHIVCYVFVDNSNLWIAGQKSQALKDADTDPRYRVDHGKFLDTVINGRDLAKAFLYSSKPPPNDSVWIRSRKRNFEVKLFDRSMVTGKEKAIEPAMACDITASYYQHQVNSSEEAVFIVVTGKLDLKHTIDTLLQQGAQFELWSWERAMAREFKQLANKDPHFEAHLLDNIKDSFSYTAFMNTRQCNLIKPDCSIVFRDLPGDKSYLYELAHTMQRLMRLFYVTSIPSSRGKQDLVFEFTKTKPELILTLLKRMDLEYEACDYPTYITSKRPSNEFKIELTNRFESHVTDELNDDFYQNLEPFLLSQSTDESSEPLTSDTIVPEDDCWLTVIHKNMDKIEFLRRQKKIPCKWKEHCISGASCRNHHSEQENELFQRHPKFNFRFWKTRMCSNTNSHHKTGTCIFAHGPEDSWCLICHIYGHLTSECKLKRVDN